MTSSTSVNQFFMQLNAFTVSTIINKNGLCHVSLKFNNTNKWLYYISYVFKANVFFILLFFNCV